MNCKAENYEAFIRFRARQWYEIETRAIDKQHRSWGRRNRLRLISRHPEFFAESGSAGDSTEIQII